MSENKLQQPCFLCGKPASLRCSKCRIEPYCSVEHQKVLWVTHKLVCGHKEPFFRMPDFTFEECAIFIKFSSQSPVRRGRIVENHDGMSGEELLETKKLLDTIQNGHKNLTPVQRTIFLARLRQKIVKATEGRLPTHILPFYNIAADMVQGMDHFQIEISSTPKQHYLIRLATSTVMLFTPTGDISLSSQSHWTEFQLTRIREDISVMKTIETIKLWYFFSSDFISITTAYRTALIEEAVEFGTITSEAGEISLIKVKSDSTQEWAALELERENFKSENNC